ncbi:MAG: bifunctional UDP-N-acetylmuramoyl-tripeptide:D-alanyl-D-alanine ligase/alanine racemase [Saprospiraceae bacterium]|nr:bifunctional UDP-N-acetylmuramoyl-tripeptide:D-alanyl-D-alanine ligase/alanine racemase [Saprospiraceae bacterium]
MKYIIPDIARILQGEVLQTSTDYTYIEHLLLDSRQILFPATALFFAVRGTRHNAHEFIPQLYAEGVRTFVISEKIDFKNYPEANFLLVSNTLDALQALAAHHRQRFNLSVIGITGSNGKTIIKEWLYQLLREDFHIVRSPRSYNSQFGVPLSVWQIQPEHNLGIFEAGISQMGEMERLAPIVHCNIGLFTNIGEAHAAGFPSIKEKIHEKAKLFEFADIIFYCKDHTLIANEIESLNKKTFSWSQSQDADLRIIQIISNQQPEARSQTSIEAFFQNEKHQIVIPFTDAASIENAIHSWAILLHLGIERVLIQKRMAHLESVEMRLELKEAINNCILVNDSYNSDLTSLTLALNFLEQQRKKARRTLILSDILQSGENQETLYSKVAQLIAEKKINRLIAIGEAIAILKNQLPKSIESWFFPSTNTFFEQFDQLNFQNEAILLKGARQFAFERIANRLALKAHKTVLEINLQNLTRNLYLYSRYLRPGVRTMAMVKAAAYGSGGAEVARLLEFQGIDYLTVAYTDEGIDLRKEGIHIPIMVLNPEEASFDAMRRYQLEPEIYSLKLLEAYALYSKNQNEKTLDFPIHLKLETGMHRLGFSENQLSELIYLLQAHPEIEIKSIFTHLAASEAPEHDDFTLKQLHLFEKMYEQIVETLRYRPLRHALNTAGVHRFPDWQMDMVRLGIGLYGLDNYAEFKEKLFTVLSLKATVSQIHDIQVGESVGYGRRWKAERPSRIGTISIGYADGLRRAVGNGKFSVWLHGQRACIVGTVAMDMCMIDITDIPQAHEGDEVELFGENLSVWELAKAYDTIPLEVLTTISERVKRVYIQE